MEGDWRHEGQLPVKVNFVLFKRIDYQLGSMFMSQL